MQASSLGPKNSSTLHTGFEKAAFHRPILKMKQGKKFGAHLTTGVDNVS
jgi:hypothetical protein